MPLCGFDKQMLDGIDSFHRGLIEIILDKTPSKNVDGKEFFMEDSK